MPIYKKVNKDFFKKWSSEMAYVVGFFSADGYMTVNKRGGQFWCIQITDRKLLESIKATIQSNHKIGIRLRKKATEKTQYRLQIGSIEMCEDLRWLGLGERKTKNMVVPKVPQRYLNDFVRGYFDGDGNVWVGYLNKHRKTPTLFMQVAFTSSSQLFLTGLLSRLRAVGVKKGSIYRSKKNFSRLQFSGSDSLQLYNFMYNHVTLGMSALFLDRKKKVFERFVKLRS